MRRYLWKWLFLSLFFWLVILLNIPKDFVDLGGDSHQYIILAEGFSQGNFFKAANYPNSPYFFYYPPVFYILISPVIYFFGRNLFLMHALVALFGYCSLMLFYNIFKKYLSKNSAFLAVICLALNPIFIIYCTKYILSDIVYLFMSGLAVIFFLKYLQHQKPVTTEGFLLILALALAYLTRYIGIALFAGIAIAILSRKGSVSFKKTIFFCLGFFVIFLSWQIFTKILDPNPSSIHSNQIFILDPYKPFLGTILDHPKYLILRFIQGVNYYYDLLPSIFFMGIEKNSILGQAGSFVLCILILAGIWHEKGKSRASVFSWYFIIYTIIIVFWPFREGGRFILPILPFIYFYCITALEKLFGYLTKPVYRKIFYIAVFSILTVMIIRLPFKRETYRDLPTVFRNFISMNRLIKNKITDKGIIMSRKPTITYFFSGHQSIVYPFTFKDDEIWQTIEKSRIKYIIVDEAFLETQRYLTPFIIRNLDKFTLVGKIDNCVLLKKI